MLDESIAQSLLEHFEGATKYNINIMNESGIIIASSDPSRIGSFHEAAYLMVSKQTPILDIYKEGDYLGTKHGINLTIEYRHKTVGVVGITGSPDEVRPLAQLLKASIEGLLEYEYQKQAQMRRTSSMDRFFNQLLWMDEPDVQELNAQAATLGYRHDAIRLPLLIVTDGKVGSEELISICKKAPLYSGQDILFATGENEALFYLTIPKEALDSSSFYNVAESYLVTFRGYLKKAGSEYCFYIGSLQDKLERYHSGFRHCRWLYKNVARGENDVLHFYNYVDQYLRAQVPMSEYRDVFSTYISLQTPDFWRDFTNITTIMSKSNHNMVKASTELHMHKNTLVYRINKIRNTLGLDPINVPEDRAFSSQVCYYLLHHH